MVRFLLIDTLRIKIRKMFFNLLFKHLYHLKDELLKCNNVKILTEFLMCWHKRIIGCATVWSAIAPPPLHKRQTGVIVNPHIEPPMHDRYCARVAGSHTHMTGGHSCKIYVFS